MDYKYSDVLKEFKERVKTSGSNASFSKETGISQPLISEIMQGKKGMSKKTINQLGFDVFYRRRHGETKKLLKERK